MSRRVMNLAHMLTQNARRHGDRTGFIWGDKSWTWREIDGHVSALAAASGRAGRRQGRPRPGPFQELRRDVLVDVRGLSARRGLGADQFPPDAGRGRLSRHRLRREGVSVPRRFSRSRHGGGQSRAGIHLADRRGDVWREVGGRRDRRSCGRQGRKRRGRLRRSLLVLLHLRHHRALQGGGADPRPDGLRGDQSSRRPDAGHDGDRCLAGGRAAVAWRRRAPARAGRARRADHPAAVGKIRHRRSVPADRGAPRQQHFHRADHSEDDGRASRGRQVRSLLAALRDLCRRADVPRGPEGGAEQARPGAGAVFRPRRGHRQHHGDAGQSARSRGRPAGPHRHLRLRAHGHAGLDPGRRRARA